MVQPNWISGDGFSDLLQLLCYDISDNTNSCCRSHGGCDQINGSGKLTWEQRRSWIGQLTIHQRSGTPSELFFFSDAVVRWDSSVGAFHDMLGRLRKCTKFSGYGLHE